MHISDIPAAGSGVSNQQNGFRYYIRQLGRAVQSGNLDAAKQAYSSLSQLPQFKQPDNSRNSNFLSALTQVGNAVQTGNLIAARQAFSSLQQQWLENPSVFTAPSNTVNVLA